MNASNLRGGILGLFAEVMRRLPDILILVAAVAALFSLLVIALMATHPD